MPLAFAIAAMALTLCSLLGGLVNMIIPGSAAKSAARAQYLMRARVLMQALAIGFLLLAWLAS